MHDPSNLTLLPPLARRTDSKILFIVLDGLGGVIGPEPTALMRATCPHLDALAARSALGRTIPVADGITPGSGPGHFALFGYDPLAMHVGRGLLEALGLGVDVREGDVAIRGNYCTLDAEGRLLDRRAGRLATELAAPLAAELNAAIGRIEDVEVEVHPGLQYRFAAVFRGPGLDGHVGDTDPQAEGVLPHPARARQPAAEKMARIAEAFAAAARKVLGRRDVANGVLLRGISGRPPLPTYQQVAQLRPVCIAAYPAYRGVARMLGMDIRTDVEPTATVADEVAVLEDAWQQPHDFYFLHIKKTDSYGEDGNEAAKAGVIESFDAQLPRILALKPDVIVITGDHSTPGPMAGHSWHPVPTLLYGPWCEPEGAPGFDEATCGRGRLGPRLPATALLRLALANAGKLAKFGA
ncbi:MAG: 2,3-bisphosphoglycerate-independent phosphoglycerate mutase [Planctomycetota bacterium]|nr:2,3-bisphosphoglycerate-independent phosphoglycerate mutase [Planctomycetota bacterium]